MAIITISREIGSEGAVVAEKAWREKTLIRIGIKWQKFHRSK